MVKHGLVHNSLLTGLVVWTSCLNIHCFTPALPCTWKWVLIPWTCQPEGWSNTKIDGLLQSCPVSGLWAACTPWGFKLQPLASWLLLPPQSLQAPPLSSGCHWLPQTQGWAVQRYGELRVRLEPAIQWGVVGLGRLHMAIWLGESQAHGAAAGGAS